MKLTTLFVAAAMTTALGSSVLAQTAAPTTSAATPTTMAPAAAPVAGARVTPSGDIVATLTASGQFTTLLKAVDTVNLTTLLKGAGPLTLFAPTDAAFAALPAGELDRLMADKTALQQLLVYHIVNAKVDSTKVVGVKGPIPSAAGKPIYVDGSGSPPKANDAAITQTDLVVSNGAIYPVDHVLMPTFTPPPSAAAEAAPAAEAPAKAPAKAAVRRKK
jgi:uncharacterized surface protein with fasciclin (FAS1) repeats